MEILIFILLFVVFFASVIGSIFYYFIYDNIINDNMIDVSELCIILIMISIFIK